MALIVQTGSSAIDFKVDEWSVTSNQLNCSIGPTADISPTFDIINTVPVVNITEDFDQYSICLFKNRFYLKEDNIFPIATEIGSSGWIFPLSIFDNSASYIPNYTENKYKFLQRFLYIAFYKLIHDVDIIRRPFFYDGSQFNTISISEFFDKETIVWIYFNPQAPKIEFYRYWPALFSYGIVPIIIQEDFHLIFQSDNFPNFFNSKAPFTTLNLKPVSPILQSNKYVIKLLGTTLKRYLDNVSRFVLLYQIVELLINRIGIDFFIDKDPFNPAFERKIFEALRSYDSFMDLKDRLSNIKSSVDEYIQPVYSESQRIAMLFSEIVQIKSEDHQDFINSCQPVTGLITNNVHEQLYAIRNKIIHSYHLLEERTDLSKEINTVNFYFELLIADLLINFIR